MVTDLFVLALVLGIFVAFARWRAGIFLVIIFGALQDPIRKLTPDTPAIMAVTCIPIWFAACLVVLTQERAWSAFRRAWPRPTRWMTLFLFSLLPATIIVFRNGSEAWRMAAIGLFGYLVPVASVLAGFAYVTARNDIRRILVFYCLFTAVMMSGTFVEYSGVAPDWAAIGTSALNIHWIRYVGMEQADLISGFYRSPDIMGWHAAALTIFALTLQLEPDRRRGPLWPVLAVMGILALLMAGRRKMIAMPVLWATFLLVSYLRAGRVSRVIGLLIVGAAIGGAVYFMAGEVSIHETYYTYAASTPTEASGRLMQDTWGALVDTFSQSGPLGRGIGSASQGTQHVAMDEARGWQESGLAKLAVELGAAGLGCALVLVLAIAQGCANALQGAQQARETATLQVSLVGFLLANGVAFLISHQVYGDALVMVLTAFMVGVVLSSPRWLASTGQRPTVAAAREALAVQLRPS